MMNESHTAETPTPPGAVPLTVVLRLEQKGPEVAREPVVEGDLSEVKGELWLANCLRKGHPGVRMDELSFQLSPVYKNGGPTCAGYFLEATNPTGETTRRHFSIFSLERSADRASKRLIAAGLLKLGELYYYEVVANRPASAAPLAARAASAAPFTVTAKNPPLTYQSAPLAPLIERAEAIGPVDDGWCPVLYTVEALEKAERFSRRGATLGQRIETGGVLIGPVCSCPDTGEFFVVVVDAIELTDAEETAFSLTYTGKTWANIQAVMRARQSQPATRAHRIVGQCHGHNFAPHNGEKDCAKCPERAKCALTSVFVSLPDRQWTQAVFARQPWAFCHVFGMDARGEKAHGLYGLLDGRLQERGFHLIADFDQG